jgi:hypothetical protein
MNRSRLLVNREIFDKMAATGIRPDGSTRPMIWGYRCPRGGGKRPLPTSANIRNYTMPASVAEAILSDLYVLFAE